jgi:hypothetical protein
MSKQAKEVYHDISYQPMFFETINENDCDKVSAGHQASERELK